MATKVLKSAGRFGARYGKRLKSKLLSVETEQKKKQICPYCSRPAAKRLAPGIWLCKKCGMKFTGHAYMVK